MCSIAYAHACLARILEAKRHLTSHDRAILFVVAAVLTIVVNIIAADDQQCSQFLSRFIVVYRRKTRN